VRGTCSTALYGRCRSIISDPPVVHTAQRCTCSARYMQHSASWRTSVHDSAAVWRCAASVPMQTTLIQGVPTAASRSGAGDCAPRANYGTPAQSQYGGFTAQERAARAEEPASFTFRPGVRARAGPGPRRRGHLVDSAPRCLLVPTAHRAAQGIAPLAPCPRGASSAAGGPTARGIRVAALETLDTAQEGSAVLPCTSECPLRG
jgi:hypothetical protein